RATRWARRDTSTVVIVSTSAPEGPWTGWKKFNSMNPARGRHRETTRPSRSSARDQSAVRRSWNRPARVPRKGANISTRGAPTASLVTMEQVWSLVPEGGNRAWNSAQGLAVEPKAIESRRASGEHRPPQGQLHRHDQPQPHGDHRLLGRLVPTVPPPRPDVRSGVREAHRHRLRQSRHRRPARTGRGPRHPGDTDAHGVPGSDPPLPGAGSPATSRARGPDQPGEGLG